MKIGAIIFSRFDSKRLPGKALIDIDGRPLLGRVIDRTKCISELDEIIVATSSRSTDDTIASFAKSEGVEVFRGSLTDVASRALCACEEFSLVKFARICGDRPFFDPTVVSRLIAMHEGGVDLTTTAFPKTYPPGLTGEVVSAEALQRAMSQTDELEDKEHVTRCFYRTPEKFVIKNLDSPKNLDLNGLHLVVDNHSDLARARWVSSGLCGIQDECNNLEQIIELAREWDRANLINKC